MVCKVVGRESLRMVFFSPFFIFEIDRSYKEIICPKGIFRAYTIWSIISRT